MKNTVVINGRTHKLTNRGKFVFGTLDFIGACAVAAFFWFITFSAFFG